MGDLATDVQALKDASNTVVAAVETVVIDVEAQPAPTPTPEDPAWTAVKAALTSNGWTAPAAPATDIPVVDQSAPATDIPVDTGVADNTPSGQ